jgi:teichuronic acid exporter
MSLRKEALSGMIWTYLQQFGSQLISFGVSIVLARLIMPEEFGLIGMIAIFMGLGSALFQGGLTSSLIRTKELTEDDYSTVFF